MMGKDTPSLFDFEDRKSDNPERNSLKIIAVRNKKLSKAQQTFNRLTKRIEKLQAGIQGKTVNLENLLKLYLTLVPEKRRSLAGVQLKAARMLGDTAKTIKYGDRQHRDLRDVILALCDEAFAAVEPDEATEAFYDTWAETSYKEEKQLQAELLKQLLADHAQDFFGVDINMDDIEATPEGFAKFAARVKDGAEMLNKPDGNSSGRKKTAKQLEREKLQMQEKELTLRTVRSIYLSLAKAMHPDTVTDPVEKSRKEELMKKVTAAYADKDLPMLLKLEMEWVASENAALHTLPDDKLNLYISSLKEQAAALEMELNVLHNHPRFAEVFQYTPYPEHIAQGMIREQAKEYALVTEGLGSFISEFTRLAKKDILAFVSQYKKEISRRNPDLEDIIIPDMFKHL